MLHAAFAALSISIHAPRGGSDLCNRNLRQLGINFNPRSPWGERLYSFQNIVTIDVFQSTLPVGGATPCQVWFCWIQPYFNPRSPWGERPLPIHTTAGVLCISIHAPRGGSDLGGAWDKQKSYISIHAPRGGSDRPSPTRPIDRGDFNPRSPWGERQSTINPGIWEGLFQSTLPVGGATASLVVVVRRLPISIHAPRGGSDPRWKMPRPTGSYFNPRSPWGERHTSVGSITASEHFNPRSPWGERLQKCTKKDMPIQI